MSSRPRVLFKLLQHLLIWLAASFAIVLGASWGYAIGFTSQRAGPQALAWMIASVTVVFAAALVQRAPLAIVILVAISAAVFPVGAWLALRGAPMPGVTYMLTSAIYLAC